ncbi:MAG TPA: thioredoxin domain-containing protein, partial [Terriglobales bacterium]|nr:thioredoxin domain-containing protein [Terriglobales bacterium]
MKRLALLFLAGALTVSVAAQSSSKPAPPSGLGAQTPGQRASNTLSRETVNEFLRHTFGYDQNLKWQIRDIKPAPDPSLTEVDVVMNTPEGQQGLRLYVTPDQKSAVTGEFLPFGSDPYAPVRNLLSEKAKGPSRGAANPAVTIVEFGDLQCPACKRAQPTIEKLMNDEPNAKLIFEQFPLTQLHKWAMTASKYALCVNRQNKDAFWKFVDTVYQNQDAMQQMTVEQVEPKLKQFATDAGVNADQAQQCTNDPAITADIVMSQELG